MKSIYHVICLFLSMLLFGACGSVEKRLRDYKDVTLDKILPLYNSQEPDNRFNRRRFEEHLKVKCTPHINNVFCYADHTGIDATYQFAFYCDSVTIFEIVKQNELSNATPQIGAEDLLRNFHWWQHREAAHLQPYWREENQWYQFLWYDKKLGKAFYLEFDL